MDKNSSELMQTESNIKIFSNKLIDLKKFIATEINKSANDTRLDILYQNILLQNVFTTAKPFLSITSFSISPEFGCWLYEYILKSNTTKILEIGSGLSTAIIGSALKKMGSGSLVALEHDEVYFNITLDLINACELQEFVTLVLSPLKDYMLASDTYKWYDIPHEILIDKFGQHGVDMMLVDGPPAATGPLARYPALPLIKDYLSNRVVIILDDGDREDEKEIVARWLSENLSTFSQHTLSDIRHSPVLIQSAECYAKEKYEANITVPDQKKTEDIIDLMSEKLNALVNKDGFQEDIADNIRLRHELVIERIISEHKISSLRRESQINALHAERRRLQANIQTLNEQMAEARTQQRATAQERDDLAERLATLEQANQFLNHQLAETQTQQCATAQERDDLAERLAALDQANQTLNDQLAETRTQQRATVRERDGLVSTLSKMESHQSVVEKMAREVFKSFDDLQRRELRARNEANLLRNKLDRIQHQHAYQVGQAIVSNLRGPKGWVKIPGALIEANKAARLDQTNFITSKKIETAHHIFSGSIAHLSLTSSWQSLCLPTVDIEKEIWITALTAKHKGSIELEIQIYPLDSSNIGGGVLGSTPIQRLIIEGGSPVPLVLLSSSNTSLCLKFRKLDGPSCIVKFELRASRSNKYMQPTLSIHNSQKRILSYQQEPNEPKAILFFCVNGAGLGHLTRTLAIARRLRRLDPKIPLRFLTSSSAVDLIEAEGISVHHIPPAQTAQKKIPTGEWNALLLKTIRQIHTRYRPRLLVYDGVFPYKGLLDAMSFGTFDQSVMVLRLRHKNNALAEKADLLARFDKLIFPGEAGEDDLNANIPIALRELPHECVDPIIFLEPNELLPRKQAREALKIDQNKRAVFVQLGAGNINDNRSWIDHIIDTLLQRSDVDVVLAESPIADQPHAIREGVHVLQQYPNSKYFNAFDLAIAAVGYNTFHELMYFGVPSILIPNQETKTDDQVQRAMVAHHAQAAIAILRPEDLAPAISVALTDEVAKMMREKSRALVPSNGAEAVAKYLRQLAMSGIPSQVDVAPNQTVS